MLASRLSLTARRALCAWLTLLLCVAALTLLAGAADASVTVNLRVEGSTATLFEGPVAAESVPAPGISTPTSPEPHQCDFQDNGENGGFGGTLPTSTAALYEAATANRLAFDAKWSTTFKDFEITQVGPDVAGGPPNFESWGYAINSTTANLGGCQIALAPGNEILWAYNYFNLAHLLALSGPASTAAGNPFTLHVSDSRTGEPIAGAAIGEDVAGTTAPLPGAATTDAAGNATISLAHPGVVALKATRSDSVRSNAIQVCVHNGNDGTCGTSFVPACTASSCPGPPVTGGGSPGVAIAAVTGVRNGRVYSRRHAPRILGGSVTLPSGATLHDVRIDLQRRVGKHCFAFSGSHAAFVRARCGVARFFSVGNSLSFTYLLPAPLPRGRYVYAIRAIDNTGRASKLVGGVSDVAFRVK